MPKTRLFSSIYLFLFALSGQSQTWTTLTNPPPAGIGLCLLLTDASVMCQPASAVGSWYKLTPDPNGSYLQGAWSSLPALPSGYTPAAFASAVLADGRLVVIGGEYNGNAFALTNMGAIYSPPLNTWTSVTPPPFPQLQCIGDAPSVVLPDGRLLIGSKLTQALAILDPTTLQWTLIAPSGKFDQTNSEEGWTLLPDGSVFTLDVRNAPGSERFLPATGSWVSAGNTPLALATPPGTSPLNASGCPPYYPAGEVGPTLLQPDGTVFAVGATGNTASYTPPAAGSSAAGSWAPGPFFPQNVEDGPGIVLPNGHVLFGASLGEANNSLTYYEFDGAALQNISPPQNTSQDAAYGTSLLLLPTGQALFIDGSTTVQLYTPASSTYNPAWAPSITSVPATLNAGVTYRITGTQFNGLDQGTAFGDEAQNATNYPLVRITLNASGHVFFARTHNHTSMGVATGSLPVSTYFDVPANIETGAAALEVIANGIPSPAVAVNITAPTGTPPGINSAGIISAGSFGAFTSASPGGWIEIYGTNLAPAPRAWAAGDFTGVIAPFELNGTTVAIGGEAAVISYVSPNQIDVQVPYDMPNGIQSVVVTTSAGAASAAYPLTVSSQPGLLAPPSFNIAGTQYAAALFANSSTYVLPSHPAHPGDTIVLYGVGFGKVTPDTPGGQAVQELNSLITPLQMFIGGTQATVTYNGLAPGYIGLYQFNIIVPNTSAGNAVPLTFTLGGAPGAQTLYIPVH